MIKVALVLAVLLVIAEDSLAHDWKYQDEEHWASVCQTGRQQSPIPLSNSIAERKEFLPLIMTGYDQIASATMTNNGHSAEVRLHILQQTPEVKGGHLKHTYLLDHLHFHWQSEHTLEGKRFPLELHLVHYAKDLGDTKEALKHRHGVAVFAVLFELSPDDDSDMKPLVEIVDNLKDRIGDPRELEKFVVKDFLPRDRAGFYRYEGSLTTPNCTEGIVWTVFTNTLPISEHQVKIFQQLVANDNSVLKQNYRSLQDINDRKVFLKVSPILDPAGSASRRAQISGALFAFVSFALYLNLASRV